MTLKERVLNGEPIKSLTPMLTARQFIEYDYLEAIVYSNINVEAAKVELEATRKLSRFSWNWLRSRYQKSHKSLICCTVRMHHSDMYARYAQQVEYERKKMLKECHKRYKDKQVKAFLDALKCS